MPGKVNPVIPESVVQVVCQVIGNDAAVAAAAQGGYLELNTYWPVAAYNLHQSITLLASAAKNFEEQCLRGITATSRGPDMVEQGLMMATGLTPAIGYDKATAIAKAAAAKGVTIRELAKSEAGLSDAELDELLEAPNVKATLPAPYIVGRRMWHLDHSKAAYPSPEKLMADCLPILRQEIEAIRNLGTDTIQLDEP